MNLLFNYSIEMVLNYGIEMVLNLLSNMEEKMVSFDG
jgi:hypothetical protein